MKAYVQATRQDGAPDDPWTSTTVIVSASQLVPNEIVLEDLGTGKAFSINAEGLVRAVRAAWEIVRPLETRS